MSLPAIVLFLRGHIRESFKDTRLSDFVRKLSTKYVVNLYIHTWNIYSTKLSWRKVDENTNRVTYTDIITYFSGINVTIKSVDIDNDSNIELIGTIDGNIFSTLLPKLAWKRMWYGINKTLETINVKEGSDILIVNTRFDVFNNSYSQNNETFLLRLIDENVGKPLTTNKFLNGSENLLGIDNYYVGTPKTMYTLVNEFHRNLDEIGERYSEISFQEVSVFYENLRLFSPEMSEEDIYKNIGKYILKADTNDEVVEEPVIDRFELLRNNLKLQNEVVLNADSRSIRERGLLFVRAIQERNIARNQNRNKDNYLLVGGSSKPPPVMRVQHTVSNWKGFGKK
jgi:hypothetical protein